MAFEQRPGTGTLFRNERRGDNEKAPNATGSASVIMSAEYLATNWDGTSDLVVPIDIGAWTKEGKRGRFQSLTVRVKGSWHPDRPAANGPRTQGQDKAEDDPSIPF